jgi:hypothetical protein
LSGSVYGPEITKGNELREGIWGGAYMRIPPAKNAPITQQRRDVCLFRGKRARNDENSLKVRREGVDVRG